MQRIWQMLESQTRAENEREGDGGFFHTWCLNSGLRVKMLEYQSFLGCLVLQIVPPLLWRILDVVVRTDAALADRVCFNKVFRLNGSAITNG